jgi:multimeric flavodoxin WrbA
VFIVAKHILVLTGSARKGGNSDLMADAFITAAAKNGHTLTKWNVGSKHLTGCIDCKTCFHKGKPCNFDPDFNELAELLEQADVLVLATPLYWYNFPSQLKAAIDKIYAYHIGNRKLPIKESYLLTCGEDKGEESFAGLLTTYKLIAGFEGWDIRGIVVVPGVAAKGDIKDTDGLERCAALGRELV